MIEFVVGRKYMVISRSDANCFVGEFHGNEGNKLIFRDAIGLVSGPISKCSVKVPRDRIIDAELWLQTLVPCEPEFNEVARGRIAARHRPKRVYVKPMTKIAG